MSTMFILMGVLPIRLIGTVTPDIAKNTPYTRILSYTSCHNEGCSYVLPVNPSSRKT